VSRRVASRAIWLALALGVIRSPTYRLRPVARADVENVKWALEDEAMDEAEDAAEAGSQE
jgi:hypothetical protein